MDIVKADFDWISLLVVVIAGVIGMIKSGSRKKPGRPVDLPRQYSPEIQEEETVEWFNNTDYFDKTSSEGNIEEIIVQGNLYERPDEQSEPVENVQEYTFTSENTEQENEELKHFNLRQAIISSEILRRPEY